MDQQQRVRDPLLPRDQGAGLLRNQWIELYDEEQRLKQEFEKAAAERARVETALKLAIGTHAGIDGGRPGKRVSGAVASIATWSKPGNRSCSTRVEQKLNAKKFETLLKALGRGGNYQSLSFQEINRAAT